MNSSTEDYSDKIEQLKAVIEAFDAIVIGAGAGLSTSAGYVYSGERFNKYFYDFAEKYAFSDMYYGGFTRFESPEEQWAYWSRYIYINRYAPMPSDLYNRLFKIVKDKDYFVLTTNVDHCFQKAGFDKHRLFYTQGDFGLLQCSTPCHNKTYDNKEIIEKMVLSQGFEIGTNGSLIPPENSKLKMTVPTELLPKCPVCGEPMTTNLRADDKFIEDEGWHKAAERYTDFIRRHKNMRVLYLELGVGMNTPVIIKYPFWQYTDQNKNAVYACINKGQAYAPVEIADRSICIDGDINEVIDILI